MLIEDGKGDLGVRGILAADIARDADEVFAGRVTQGRDESDMRDKIQLRKTQQFRIGHRALEAKKPIVARLLTESLEMLEQAFTIVRTQCANMDRSAVAQNLFGAVVSEIGNRFVDHDSDAC